jgi:hypothetical protein
MINLSELQEHYADQPEDHHLRHVFDMEWQHGPKPPPAFRAVRFKADDPYP